MDTWSQLAEFVRTGSDDAFGRVVSDHLDMVYATALRKTGHPDAAGEITQATFIVLAEKARSLKPKGSLGAWLHRTALYKSMEWIKKESRRREQWESIRDHASPENTPDVWQEIEPQLDEAVDALNEKDRHAILLRFFQQQSFREVGQALGIGEEAARKRVNRGLDRLHRWFKQRGCTISTASLTACMAHCSTQAGPANLLSTIILSVQSSPAIGGLTASSLTTWITLMKTKTMLYTGLGLVGIATLIHFNRPSTESSQDTAPTAQTGTTQIETPATEIDPTPPSIVDAARQLSASANQSTSTEDLREQFRTLLYDATQTKPGSQDPAVAFLRGIPVAERGILWDLVQEAFHSGSTSVKTRATRLLPLMWPQHKEVLPTLFERLQDPDPASKDLINATFYALDQIITDPPEFNALIESVMQASPQTQRQFALGSPVALSKFRENESEILPILESYLNAEEAPQRMLAAQILAQSKEGVSEQVVEILTQSLSADAGVDDPAQRFTMSLIWKMGSKGASAVPALMELADQNPAWGEFVDLALKSILPDALEGFGIQTPLPEMDEAANTTFQRLSTHPGDLQQLIQKMERGESGQADILALAALGTDAKAAVPALMAQMDALIRTNPQEALVVGAAIERIELEQPKPLLSNMDFVPVLEGIDLSFSQPDDLPGLQQSLRAWTRSLMEQALITRDALPSHVDQLGAIHPDLKQQFINGMLKQDARWKPIFSVQE